MNKNLRDFIESLESSNDLVRIKEEVSTKFEVQAILKYIDKGKGPAVYFENVSNYDIPVVGNVWGRRRRLAQAMGVPVDRIVEEYNKRRQKPVKPQIVDDGPVKEVVHKNNIDITGTMPALTYHEKDAGPYFSSAVIMAKDPETGIRGMGIHRVQVKDSSTIGLFLGTPPLSKILKKAEKRNQLLEIAVVIGMDPITHFSSVIYAPEGIDKFDVAGAIAQSPVKLVKCSTVDLEVPAEAEFVLEGQIIPNYRENEGPFGESSGYYLSFDNPVAQIQAITHRKNPVYHAIGLFTQEESVLMDIVWAIDHLKPLQERFPQIKKVEFKQIGQICVVQIDKKTDNDTREIIEELLSLIFTKMVIVVDLDVNIEYQEEIDWAFVSRVQMDKDIIIKPDMMGSMIDPSAKIEKSTADDKVSNESAHIAKVSKIGIDATKPLDELDKYEKIDVPPEVKEKIESIIKNYNTQ